jgi:hypothetical protein
MVEMDECEARMAEVRYRRLVVVLGIFVSVVVILALSVTALTFVDQGNDDQARAVAECHTRWDARLRRSAAAYFAALGEIVVAHYEEAPSASNDELVTAMHATLGEYRSSVDAFNVWQELPKAEQVPCPVAAGPVPS